MSVYVLDFPFRELLLIRNGFSMFDELWDINNNGASFQKKIMLFIYLLSENS